MCRNAMCPNFGIQFSGDRPEGARSISDERYVIDVRRGRLRCRFCQQSASLSSNLAIRRVARQFLQWSLPFADCPDASCRNHGVNLFENHPPDARPSDRPYAREGSERARCRACGVRFRLGTPLRLHVARGSSPQAARRAFREAVIKVRDNVGTGRTLEGIDLTARGYYAHRRAAGERLRDYLSWRNSALLRPGFRVREGPAKICTDVMTASLRRLSVSKRHQPLAVAVTTLHIEEHRTDCVLAAHAGFAPMSKGELAAMLADTAARRRAGEPPHESPWECLEHPRSVDRSKSVAERRQAQPQFNPQGQFVTERHMLLAHFLVVRKLLRRFPKVLHAMDGSKPQAAAALTALADEVRAGRWEIAMYQGRSKSDEDSPYSVDGARSRESIFPVLDDAWAALQERWAMRRQKEGGGLVEPTPELDARLFRQAHRGAFSKDGGWAWLDHPPEGPVYKGGRTLWATQRPGSSYEEVGRELLWDSSVLPADRVHARLRDRVASLSRPGLSADAQRSFSDSPTRPNVALEELWIGLMERAFVLPTTHGKITRARAMGIAHGNERPRKLAEMADLAWTFRLGFEHAEAMSGQ